MSDVKTNGERPTNAAEADALELSETSKSPPSSSMKAIPEEEAVPLPAGQPKVIERELSNTSNNAATTSTTSEPSMAGRRRSIIKLEENVPCVLERNESFIVKKVDRAADQDSDDLSGSESDSNQEERNSDLLPEVNEDTQENNLRNRKTKPPDLKLDINPSVLRQNAQESSIPSPLRTSGGTPDDPDQFLASSLKSKLTVDVGRSSPIVKRSSMLEKILEIPDVKAALVVDEGCELLRRRSYDNAAARISDRQATPGCELDEDRFSFDPNSPRDFDDLESVSDTSSLQSFHDTSLEGDKSTNHVRRPHINILKDLKGVSNPLDRIADSTGPLAVFGSPIRKQGSVSSPSLRKKWRKKANSTDDDEDETKPTTPKSLLRRLKFSSLSRSGSSSNLEGWDSLARALARVGATLPSLIGMDMDEEDIFPKFSPILKRRSHVERWSSESSSSSQDPGRPTMRKKTVSFSSLPSETNVKNAADCVYRMHDGHQFVKLRSNSRVYNRLYWFDQTENCLRWEPSKKDAGKARIEINHVREVRPGKTTELFLTSDLSTHFPDECSFSVIHGEGKTLDLIANSADDANVWITGLRCLMSGQDMEGLKMRSDARDSWLSSVFDGADINGDGFLDEDESLKLLTSLSDGVRELRVKQRLQEYLQMKPDNKAHLSRAEFIKIFKDVATRPEVYFLLARYATADDRLTVDDLLTFLESEQGAAQVTTDDCLELIKTFEPSERLRSYPALGIDGFTKFLNSERCTIFNPKHFKVCQDMTQPLTDYFIASSHNTYLMEDQVGGPSNVNAYVRALLRCCRCVELDCWDGADGDPVVTHGHSKTNNIPFRQVIQVINDSAFRNSPFPVILSLENHCSEKQQVAMAKYLKDILGDQIYTKEIALGETSLPSPESLKRRFLIRARKLPSNFNDDVGYVSDEDEGREVGSQLVSTPPCSDDPSSCIIDQAENRQLLVRDLSELVSICISVSQIEDLNAHQRSFSYQHTSSIREKIAMKLVETSPDEFLAHNKKFLTRVYPSPLRLDSSNFNPQDFWNCGVQIAALNYQTPGLMMDINDGKFSMNGGCGYVLKPAVMRDPLAYYSLVGTDSLPSVAPKNLHIRVISGQNFPKPRGGGAKGHVIDPYVLIELFGVPCDCAEHRTRTAPNNSGGFPIFDEPFEFHLALPSLALVRFVVLDDDYIGDEFIGQYTIPLECMQPGYRHLHLRSIFDEPLDNATLFVYIAITDADSAPNTPGSGALTPTSNPMKLSSVRRPNSQKRNKKYRSRKESDVIQLCEIGRAELDDVFGEAYDPLQLAAILRDSFRSSLNAFREACGLSSPSSIKQCVRALAHRNRTDVPFYDVTVVRNKRKLSNPAEVEESEESIKDGGRRRIAAGDNVSRLRRQHSDTSQSSSSDSGVGQQVRMVRNEKKISFLLRGGAANSDVWKKVASTLDALVDDCLALLDKATTCCGSLTAVYDKAAKLRTEVSKWIITGPESSESGDSVATSNGSQSKKLNKMKKKQSLSLDIDRKKRRSTEENFRWNCSTIQGHRDMLMSTHEKGGKILDDLWNAALQYGLADDVTSGQVNGVDGAGLNENTNNNQHPAAASDESRKNGGKRNSFVRSMSQLTKPKAHSRLSKRSASSDVLLVKM